MGLICQQIGDVELNDEIDFKKVEEQVRNATDIFGDIAHFIDTEADNYRMPQIQEYKNYCVCVLLSLS